MLQVLLIHGFTSHPTKVWGPLPELLRREGYKIFTPTLSGHGGEPEDMATVKAGDWLQDVRRAAGELQPGFAVVGLSMGSLLAAFVAAENEVSALVAAVPALAFSNPLAPLAPYLSWLLPKMPGAASIRDQELRKQNPNYPYFPTRSFVELLRLSRQTPTKLPAVRAPALVLGASHDKVIPAGALRRYYQLLGSAEKELLFIEGSGHDVFLDARAEEASARVISWLRRY